MHTLELGRRVELVSMDPHFHSITLALYWTQRYRIHTYSQREGAADRVAFLNGVSAILGGMEKIGEELAFPCGSIHLAAARRVFLEACKIPMGAAVAPKPLSVFDKKSGHEAIAISHGQGVYELSTTAPADRRDAISNGLKKLAELESDGSRLRFSCGMAHDALAGLLLPRALNVRAILREEEMAASRGVLAAPSAQKE